MRGLRPHGPQESLNFHRLRPGNKWNTRTGPAFTVSKLHPFLFTMMVGRIQFPLMQRLFLRQISLAAIS